MDFLSVITDWFAFQVCFAIIALGACALIICIEKIKKGE